MANRLNKNGFKVKSMLCWPAGLVLLVSLVLTMILVGCSVSWGQSINPKSPGVIPGNLNSPQQVLYIPLDNRPLNYSNVLPLAEMARVQLVMPPTAMLGQGSEPGQAQNIQRWLGEQAHLGDVWVISLDMLLYGGLAPSRSHDLKQADVLAQIKRLRQVLMVAKERQIPVYMLATSMRSAASSKSAQQPSYFAQHGDGILRLSQLTDLADLKQATPAQLAEIEKIKKTIPSHILEDYLNRRQVNLAALQEAVKLTADGLVSYLVIGRDDTTPYSFTQMEMRQIKQLAAQQGVSERVDSYPGADELGAMLLARAVNVLQKQTPRVYVSWGTPRGADITALYEDITLHQSTLLHIKSGGARVVPTPQEADLILVMNTPESKVIEAVLQHPPIKNEQKNNSDSDSPSGNATPLPHHVKLVQQIASWQQTGVPVAVADVAYANGSDLALMTALSQAKVVPDLASYAGCNTAGNSIGMALAQGLIYLTMNQGDTNGGLGAGSFDASMAQLALRQCLFTRLGEDWGYQATVRPALVARQSSPLGAGTTLEDQTVPLLEKEINQELNNFFQANINPIFKEKIKITQVTLPWHRLFDIDFKVQWDRI